MHLKLSSPYAERLQDETGAEHHPTPAHLAPLPSFRRPIREQHCSPPQPRWVHPTHAPFNPKPWLKGQKPKMRSNSYGLWVFVCIFPCLNLCRCLVWVWCGVGVGWVNVRLWEGSVHLASCGARRLPQAATSAVPDDSPGCRATAPIH